MATILVIDDEMGIRALLQEILTDEGHSVELAEDAAQARLARERVQPDLILLDIWMPDVDGITLLKEWSTAGSFTTPVIMMSGHGTIDTAVEAAKFGALSFLEKPITLQKLLKAIQQGLARPSAPRASGASSVIDEVFQRDVIDPVTNRPASSLPLEGDNQLSAGSAVANLSAEMQMFALDRPLREARDAFEKAYFEFHLARESGSMTRVAERTGLERTHLYRKLKQLGVDLGRMKRSN